MWSVLFRDSGWWNAIRGQRSRHLVVWLARYYFSLNITHLSFWGSPLHSKSTWFQSGDYIFVQMWELDHKRRPSAEELMLLNCDAGGCSWTARRSNQSILKEINPEYSLEWVMLKLKFQYFGHLMRRAESLENTLMLGKIEGGGRRNDRGGDGWMASPTPWTWIWVSSGSWWWTGRPGMLQSMGSQRVRHDWVTELNWKYPVDPKDSLSEHLMYS